MSTPQLNPWRRRAPDTPLRAPVVLLAGSPGGHLDLLLAVGPRLRGVEKVWVTAPGPPGRAPRAPRRARRTRARVRPQPVARDPEPAPRRRDPAPPAPGPRDRLRLQRRRADLAARAAVRRARPVRRDDRPRRRREHLRPRHLARRLGGARPVGRDVQARTRAPCSAARRCGSRSARRRATASARSSPSAPVTSRSTACSRPSTRPSRPASCPAPVVAQSGHTTYRPRTFEPTPWLEPAQVEEAAGRARYVVCHSGSGIIGAALRNGKRPLVLPRLHSQGEHVDDHQLQIAHKLEHMGLAVALDDHIAAGPPPGRAVAAARERREQRAGRRRGAADDDRGPQPDDRRDRRGRGRPGPRRRDGGEQPERMAEVA